MALPLPNSPHGDQLISAKPRGTARFLSDLHNGEVERGIAPAEHDPCGDDEKAISGERGHDRAGTNAGCRPKSPSGKFGFMARHLQQVA